MSLIRELLTTFVHYFRLFRRLTGNHMYALTALNVVMGYAEGIGIALFFPLLRSQDEHDMLASSLAKVFRVLHIPATPTGALPFIVLAFVLKGLLMLVTYTYQGRLAAQIPMTLRREIVVSLRRLDYRAIVGSNTGFLSNLLVNEVSKVGSAFIFFARTFPPTLNVAVFFAIVLWLDWRLTMLCLLMGLCAAVVLRVTGRIAQNASRATVTEGSVLTSLLIQMVQAFKYLRATAGFRTFEDRIGSSSERLAHAEYRNSAASALSQSVSQPLMVVFLAAILFYQAKIRGEALGSLFVLLLYFVRIMTELWTVQYNWQSFLGYTGPIELVRDSLASFERQVEASGARPFTGLQDEISLNKVSFRFLPERPVLRDVDLAIRKNATIAFVGESGSGKSTLVDLIMGTLKPDSGTISIDGVPLGEIDLETLRRRIGYVPQDAMLFDDTVANNIALWASADEERIRDAALRARCLEFIDAMPDKLATPIGDRGIKLSGGQRQRLAIARELFKNPDILVLDEATSALDSESERAIQLSIDAIKGHMTILIIAHRLSTIRNCDLVCVIHEGEIVERGTYDELIGRAGSRFRRMVELQHLTQDSDRAAAGR
jgi:ABC-type multidrug transport system fused ATPase/permease subunit